MYMRGHCAGGTCVLGHGDGSGSFKGKTSVLQQLCCWSFNVSASVERLCIFPPSCPTSLCWYFLAGFVFSQPCMNPRSYSRISAVFASVFCELFLTDLFEAVLDFLVLGWLQ
jgi:hypothetical protein